MQIIVILFSGLLLFPSLNAQNIYINEFLASNVTDYPEMYDFDDYSDWIELYNSGNEIHSLENLFLTDDLDHPFKWKINDGAFIEAQSYFIIWADDFNVGPGQEYMRPYWPWDNFTTRHYHSNFKLSKSGEHLAIYQAEQMVNDTLVPKSSNWKYYCSLSSPSQNWFENDYDDSDWSSGFAELGYGDGDEETIVDYGPDPDNKYITTYFRHAFSANMFEDINTLTFNIKRDDGAVVFLNGNEILRSNMPSGSISHETYASSSVSGPEEDTFFETVISSDGLIQEQNIIAVEIHQRSNSSSDISFDLELVSENYFDAVLVDSVVFSEQITDVSYGRKSEDNSWAFFGEPTPGTANNTSSSNNTEISGTVISSLAPGFYNNSISVELSSISNEEQIYYTLDGSRPGSQASLYTTPILIENTVVLKARAFSVDKLPGGIFVTTYFIDEENNLPTISLIAEPETLWDQDIGIYVNEYKQREIPVTIQYFDQDSELKFSARAGARLGGQNIWTKPQKPFTIYTRDRFGQDFINYQLFENKQIANFSRFVFRNGGDDWEETIIRDPMTESIVSGMMLCGYMAYSPSSLFLNGNYWGIHNIREKFNTHYFFENYGVDPNNIDHLEYGSSPNGTELLVIDGDLYHYNTMLSYIVNQDLNDPENYQHIEQWMNVDSFIDHIIMTIYCANTSWGHNREWWRARTDDGKWNWMIVDLDRGFNMLNANSNLLDDLMEDYELFKYLLESQFFLERFIQRSAAHLSNTFASSRIEAIVDSLSSKIAPEINLHINRWSSQGGISSINHWQDELSQIKQFSLNRNSTVMNHFIGEFNLDGTIELSTVVIPEGAGQILINDVPVIEPDDNGSYFKNKPVSISVVPNPGYQFVGWQDLSNSSDIIYDCSVDTFFIAVFELSNEIILPSVFSESTSLDSFQTYVATNDIRVPELVTLTINEGSQIKMMENINLIIEGKLIINGTDQNPVEIFSHSTNSDNRWGSICFNNSVDTSLIMHAKITGASTGIDPTLHHGAISSINSNIIIDHIEIEDVEFPVYVQGGSVMVSDCSISCDYICDFINVQGGNALIENSVFYGANAVDTDAIDLDNVEGGIIRGNKIYNFSGSNSDGIDIGEQSQNIIIESNLIFHSKDKGVSVGQGSSVSLRKNLIVGCNIGIAVKDYASADVINNTFFQNDTSILAYEKNPGAGGGSIELVNNIISNSRVLSVYYDEMSSLNVNYCLSDSELLNGSGNIFSEPSFIDESLYNLELRTESVCIDAGDPTITIDEDGSLSDIGAYYTYDETDYPFAIPDQFIDQLVINELLAENNSINSDDDGDFDDWIELYNPTDHGINISGLYLTDDLDDLDKWRFLDTTLIIESRGFIIVWCDNDNSLGSLHTNFKLSSDGEDLALVKSDGESIIDHISFGAQTIDLSYGRIPDGSEFWNITTPTPGSSNSELFTTLNSVFPNIYQLYQNFPNPFNPITTIRYDIPIDGIVSINIYDLMGKKIKTLVDVDQTAGNKTVIWDAKNHPSGVYIINMEGRDYRFTKKILLLK